MVAIATDKHLVLCPLYGDCAFAEGCKHAVVHTPTVDVRQDSDGTIHRSAVCTKVRECTTGNWVEVVHCVAVKIGRR